MLQRLQLLHVHVFLVAPLGARHMTQPGADEHQGRVPVWEAADYSCPPSNLSIQAFYDIVCADSCPVLQRKIAIGQRFLNPIFYLLCCLRQLHGSQLRDDSSGFLSRRFLTLLSMNGFDHLGDELHLGLWHVTEYISVEVNDTALVFSVWKDFFRRFQHTQTLVPDNELHAVETAAFQPLKEADQLALSSFIPSAALRTSRKPSSLTTIATKTATFSYSLPQFRRR